jgi:hypothetical protein
VHTPQGLGFGARMPGLLHRGSHPAVQPQHEDVAAYPASVQGRLVAASAVQQRALTGGLRGSRDVRQGVMGCLPWADARSPWTAVAAGAANRGCRPGRGRRRLPLEVSRAGLLHGGQRRPRMGSRRRAERPGRGVWGPTASVRSGLLRGGQRRPKDRCKRLVGCVRRAPCAPLRTRTASPRTASPRPRVSFRRSSTSPPGRAIAGSGQRSRSSRSRRGYGRSQGCP